MTASTIALIAVSAVSALLIGQQAKLVRRVTRDRDALVRLVEHTVDTNHALNAEWHRAYADLSVEYSLASGLADDDFAAWAEEASG